MLTGVFNDLLRLWHRDGGHGATMRSLCVLTGLGPRPLRRTITRLIRLHVVCPRSRHDRLVRLCYDGSADELARLRDIVREAASSGSSKQELVNSK